ncbi:hypothetical protein RvY_10416 [Ramazzottius varieornatus]|uniref:Histone H2A n=1 Tax=Ramazzottius varieornatus TaxID=947166 RepID=A0A1D1VCN7_RAMVA|nr:hypothetical protein RvY_10416 [Ramazzottius varieornatus]
MSTIQGGGTQRQKGEGSRRRKDPTSHAKKAGIVFSVSRIHRHLKQGNYAQRIGTGASVYAAAVIEYLVAEVMELAGHAARDNKRGRITPRHIMLAIRNDEELSRLLGDVIIAEGGVIPQIQPVLLKKKTESGGAGAEQTQSVPLKTKATSGGPGGSRAEEAVKEPRKAKQTLKKRPAAATEKSPPAKKSRIASSKVPPPKSAPAPANKAPARPDTVEEESELESSGEEEEDDQEEDDAHDSNDENTQNVTENDQGAQNNENIEDDEGESGDDTFPEELLAPAPAQPKHVMSKVILQPKPAAVKLAPPQPKPRTSKPPAGKGKASTRASTQHAASNAQSQEA